MSPGINMGDISKTDSAVHSFYNQYIKRTPIYNKLLVAIENQCHYTLAENNISHFTESRVKDPQSLRTKLDQRKNGAQYLSVKSIEDNIVDICGVRIVFHYMTDQHKINSILESMFHIQEIKYHSGGREQTQSQSNDEWGHQLHWPDYIGTHYRGFVRSEIFNERLNTLSAADQRVASATMIEVQVRSIMDDIWARYAHSIYKSEEPSSGRREPMLTTLRSGLENVREVTIQMQKSAFREEEKNNRKFETNDEVGTCFRKLIRVKCGQDFKDHTGASFEALKIFLESIDKNTPSSLHKLLKPFNFSIGPDTKYDKVKRLYESMEFDIVLYLIDQVLLTPYDTVQENEALPAKRKIEIIMSTILWMSKLLWSPWVWKIKLANTPSQKSPRKGLEWLSGALRQRGMLTKGRDLNDDDKATLDELWNLFKDHDQRPIQLAFAMSSRGMIRDVVRERQEVARVIEELLEAPNFHSQTL